MAFAGKPRLNVLFFAQRFPFPLDAGGKIRTAKLLEQLSREFELTFICNVEHPKDDPCLDQARKICSAFHPVPWKEVSKGSPAFYLRILARLWSRLPIIVLNDYSADLERTLHHVLAQGRFDLIVCDFLQPSLNLRKVTGYPTLLFQHNVESMIYERYYKTATNPWLKLFWRSQWKKLHRYEGEACRRFTGVVAVSDVDKSTMEREFEVSNVHAIPTGVDLEYFTPRQDQVIPNSLVFTGSMDWLPNEDALLFFAEEILGRVKAKLPDVTLSIVGRKPSARLLERLQAYPEIKILGRVDDIRPHIGRHAAYIIPLRIGGGTRIKFYEAMAMGKAVVSTSIGAEGLPVTHGREVLLADTAEDFAASVVRVLSDQALRIRLEQASRTFVEAHCSWAQAATVFADIARRVAASPGDETCITRRGSARS